MKRLEDNVFEKGDLGILDFGRMEFGEKWILENGILGKWEFEKRGFWVKIFGKRGFSAKGILGKEDFGKIKCLEKKKWKKWILG